MMIGIYFNKTHMHSCLERRSEQKATENGFIPGKSGISEANANDSLLKESPALNDHFRKNESQYL